MSNRSPGVVVGRRSSRWAGARHRLKTRRSWPSAAGGGCNRSPIRSAGSRASSWNTLATNIRVPGISALRSLAGAAWQARRPGGSERPLNSFVHFAASKPTSRGLAFGYISLYRTPQDIASVIQCRPNSPALSRPFEDCEGCPRLLGFAIYVWTIRTQVVQIHIAISVAWEAGRLARYIPRRSTSPVPTVAAVHATGCWPRRVASVSRWRLWSRLRR
jgi:hypothetical protein